MESNAAVFVDGRRVDFRAQSSTRAPQSLVAAVFLVLLPRADGLVPLWSSSTDDELGRSIRTEGTAKANAILPALPSVEIACKLHAGSPTPVVNPAKGSPHDSNWAASGHRTSGDGLGMAIRSGHTVLTQGAGGVSIFALQLAPS